MNRNVRFLLVGLLLAATLVAFAAPVSAGSGTVTVNLLKSDNTTGVAGGILQHYVSGGSWATVCTTNSSGTCSGLVTLPGNSTDFKLLYYGGTKSFGTVDVTTNPTLTANTTPVTVKLETCAGAALSGKAYWNAGGAWGYMLIGTTTPASTELLPGSYAFRVNYSAHNGANASFSNTKNQDISANSVVVFNTTKVTLFGNNITYYENSPTSGWVPFVNPSEMLPGTVKDFKFNGVAKKLTIAGCSFSGGFLTVKDENGNGVPGGKATPACGGSWQPTLPGATDASGQLWAELPACTTKIKMGVNQSGQEKSNAQLLTDNYTWQTGTATINVKHWDGSGFAGVVIDQGGGTWVNGIATTDASGIAKIPMFPGSGTFRANWNKTTQQLSQAVPSTFVFQTGQVHSVSGTCTKWSPGGSHETFTQDMEVFPGNYRFGTPYVYYSISAGIVNPIP